MGRAKDLIVKPISAQDANKIILAIHYSHKVVQNSQVHLGVFLDGKCGGAMQFGPSLDKSKIQGLVEGTGWNEFLELNRLAFADWLPKNGESRALGYAFRWLKKTYPWLKWIISFADGTQCGDGTIYRASGFVLTGIKKNTDLFLCEDGTQIHSMTIKSSKRLREKYGGWKEALRAEHGDYKPLIGFQLRYIYFLEPSYRNRLTVPILPFSEIAKRGAKMYRGLKPSASAGSVMSDTLPFQGRDGGAIPTPAHHSFKRGSHAKKK